MVSEPLRAYRGFFDISAAGLRSLLQTWEFALPVGDGLAHCAPHALIPTRNRGPSMSRQIQAGFSMIELMIVVAIIGVLGVLAAPAYQSYTIRGQVSEGFSLADGWKEAVLEYYAANGTWPSQSDLPGTSQSVGKYETEVTVNAGVIQITYGGAQASPSIAGAVLTIVPYTNDNDQVLWQCGSAVAPAGTIASGATAGGTTLATQLLPAACHA